MKPKEINLYSSFRGRCLVDTALLQTGHAKALTVTVWQPLINRLSKPVKLCSWFRKAADFNSGLVWLSVPEKLQLLINLEDTIPWVLGQNYSVLPGIFLIYRGPYLIYNCI